MGAATRVEEAISSAERVDFDLPPVLAAAVGAYGAAFPQRTFRFDTALATLTLRGAPDLIVQMLDKLIENAVDFSPARREHHGAPAPGSTRRADRGRESRSGAAAARGGAAVRVAVALTPGGATSGRISDSACTSCG